MLQEKLGKIHHADCIEFMQDLPDGCINLIFADPLRDAKLQRN